MKDGIIYEGPSAIDGKPIVAIAIAKSNNTKTGNMVQTFIIRSDIDPRVASQTGEDESICGKCVHRGESISTLDSVLSVTKTGKKGEFHSYPMAKNRSCYVTIHQGVLNVYKKYKRGGYPMLTDRQARELTLGRMLRIGTYGDGAAVPVDVWRNMMPNAKGHTAYTHQWKSMPVAADIFMASADSEAEARIANEAGFRTFRVASTLDTMDGEIMCPAAPEAGSRTTCENCGLCAGTSNTAKNIMIPVHGAGKRNFTADPNIIAVG